MYPNELPPSGEITEIVGRLSSGGTSLFHAWLAAITRAGGVAALVDTDETFDPASAARAGVVLERLLWIRCGGRRRAALVATDLLVRRPGFAMIALDTGEIAPRITLETAFRLKFAVRRTRTALVVLGRRRLTGSGAALAIETVQDGLEWSGPGPRPTRLDAVRTRLHLLRPHAARHPRAGGPWPRAARFSLGGGLRPSSSSEGASTAPSETPPDPIAPAKPALERGGSHHAAISSRRGSR